MDHIVQGTAKWDHCASLVQEELDRGIGTLMLDCIRWALIAGPVGRDPHVGPPVLLDHATLTEILRVTTDLHGRLSNLGYPVEFDDGRAADRHGSSQLGPVEDLSVNVREHGPEAA